MNEPKLNVLCLFGRFSYDKIYFFFIVFLKRFSFFETSLFELYILLKDSAYESIIQICCMCELPNQFSDLPCKSLYRRNDHGNVTYVDNVNELLDTMPENLHTFTNWSSLLSVQKYLLLHHFVFYVQIYFSNLFGDLVLSC